MSFCLAKKTDGNVYIERLTEFKGSDLPDLCEALERTIDDGGAGFSIGFNWLKAPSRERLESYYKGLMLVPERSLYVGRLDGVIASSIQLVKPAPSNHFQNFAGTVREHFVAPWARGHGLAKMLISAVEEEALAAGLKILKLEVRATQDAAIAMYESAGFKKWGELDKYEMVDGKFVSGCFYYKDLN
jgi:ribosomal protein S18 acetylase RimI-like enzyme